MTYLHEHIFKNNFRFHQDRGREVPLSSQSRFRGSEAPWFPSTQIEVEKPFGHRNSRLRQKSLSIALSSDVEKPLGYLPSKSRYRNPLVATIQVPRQRSPLVTFHSDRGREVLWSSQFKIKIKKPLNRPMFRGKEFHWIPSIQIEVEKPLDRPPQIQTKIEKPLGQPRFQDSLQVYQLSIRSRIHNFHFSRQQDFNSMF